MLLRADDLEPGDQISWNRFLTHDHHALVKEVKNENTIIVYDFAKGDKKEGSPEESGNKVRKTERSVSLFNGFDPVYKIIHHPAADPQMLLAAAESGSLRKEGNYNIITNNCENYAGNNKGLDDQVRGCCLSFITLLCKAAFIILMIGVKAAFTLIFDKDLHKTFIHHCYIICHVLGFVFPILIEMLLICWDLKVGTKWKNHRYCRIGGIFGTIITSGVATAIALKSMNIWLIDWGMTPLHTLDP